MLDHLPERDRPDVKRRLRAAWAEHDHGRALDRLQTLAGELERTHPGAAGSLRMTETQSMIECIRRTSRNVKRWSSGEMALRWTAATCSKPNASSGGSSATAISQSSPSRSSATSLEGPPPSPTEETATLVTAWTTNTGTAVAKFHDERECAQRFGGGLIE